MASTPAIDHAGLVRLFVLSVIADYLKYASEGRAGDESCANPIVKQAGRNSLRILRADLLAGLVGAALQLLRAHWRVLGSVLVLDAMAAARLAQVLAE